MKGPFSSFIFLFFPIYASSHIVQFQLIIGWIFLLMSAFQNSPCLKTRTKGQLRGLQFAASPALSSLHLSASQLGNRTQAPGSEHIQKEESPFLKIQAHADFMFVILFFLSSSLLYSQVELGSEKGLGGKKNWSVTSATLNVPIFNSQKFD